MNDGLPRTYDTWRTAAPPDPPEPFNEAHLQHLMETIRKALEGDASANTIEVLCETLYDLEAMYCDERVDERD